jgi:nicotinamidase-related amidase
MVESTLELSPRDLEKERSLVGILESTVKLPWFKSLSKFEPQFALCIRIIPCFFTGLFLDAMTLYTDKTALIIIDVQDGLDDPELGKRNNPHAERNMARLLAAWRRRGSPIFHVQHMSTRPDSPLRPGQPGNAIKRIVAPQEDEPVFQKTVNNAFIGTDLGARLRDEEIHSLVIVGLTTNHCVSATARMAGDLGFETFVVEDATASHETISYDGTLYPAEMVHAIALANLHDEFATIVKTDRLLGSR